MFVSEIQGIDKTFLYEMPEASTVNPSFPGVLFFSKDFNASKYSFVVIFFVQIFLLFVC